MRPDPYKRARSRQYKAKHGIFDPNKYAKQDDCLPSNILGEKLWFLGSESSGKN